MLKTKVNNQLKDVKELYKRNTTGTGVDYIGELYKKTNQLWNPQNSINAYVNPATTTDIIKSNAQCVMYWFPIEAGKTYTMYGSTSNRFRVGFTTVQPAVGVNANVASVVDTTEAHTYTFTNTNNYNYCFAQVTNVGVEPSVFNAVEGSTASTEYISYGVEEIFSAGYDTTISGTSPLTLPNARAKSISWQIDGQSHQGLLPDGYTQLEYIQSDGSAYIDTGYSKPNKSCIIETKLSYSDITSRYLIGISNNSPNYFGRAANGKFELSGTYTSITSGEDIPCILTYTTTDSDVTLEVNNGTSSETLTAGRVGTTSNYNWCICGNNANGTPTFIHSGRIYYFRLTDNGTLVRNMMPAKNSSNVLGMYDLVSGQFLTNAGSGTFTAGQALPTPTNPLEVYGVGKKTENLFDMHYDVAYTGSYPNITTVAGGKSTEWLDTDQFGSYFYFVWNVNTLNSNCVLGLVYSNDKSEVLYRDGLVNASTLPNINTDVALGGGNPYRINHTYKYVKFYVLNWAYTNRLAVYVNSVTSFIPYGYKVPILQANNCGMVDLGTLNWVKSVSPQRFECTTTIADLLPPASNEISSYCNKRFVVTTYDNSGADKSIFTSTNGFFRLYDSQLYALYSNNISAFKQAISGTCLYYQRATDETFSQPVTHYVYIDRPLMAL